MQTELSTQQLDLLKTIQDSPESVLSNQDFPDLKREDHKDKVVCRQCRYHVTELARAISVNSSHEHSFFNPHGYVFQVRCFSSAPGCITTGEPSTEFSWFAGYSWEIAACSNCLTHLGWKFQSNSDSFFGLIKNSIIEISTK